MPQTGSRDVCGENPTCAAALWVPLGDEPVPASTHSVCDHMRVMNMVMDGEWIRNVLLRVERAAGAVCETLL